MDLPNTQIPLTDELMTAIYKLHEDPSALTARPAYTSLLGSPPRKTTPESLESFTPRH